MCTGNTINLKLLREHGFVDTLDALCKRQLGIVTADDESHQCTHSARLILPALRLLVATVADEPLVDNVRRMLRLIIDCRRPSSVIGEIVRTVSTMLVHSADAAPIEWLVFPQPTNAARAQQQMNAALPTGSPIATGHAAGTSIVNRVRRSLSINRPKNLKIRGECGYLFEGNYVRVDTDSTSAVTTPRTGSSTPTIPHKSNNVNLICVDVPEMEASIS
jgi:hypothetical protein